MSLDKFRKDYEKNRQEWIELLEAAIDRKEEECTVRDKQTGEAIGWNYLRQWEMMEAGEW